MLAALIALAIFVSLGELRDSILSLPFPVLITALSEALDKL